jgi:nucleoside-diphosphate-sugar epimerase
MEAFHKVTNFKIGSGEGRSVLEALPAVEAVAGCCLVRRVLPAGDFDVLVNVLDMSRAHEHLGGQLRTSLRQGLGRTFTWLLAH